MVQNFYLFFLNNLVSHEFQNQIVRYLTKVSGLIIKEEDYKKNLINYKKN